MIRPHTVTVYLPAEVVDDDLLLGHSSTSQGTVKGQLTPVNSDTVVQKFGLDLKDARLFLCNSSDASKFATGGRFTYGSVVMSVAANPMTYDGIGAADHCEVLLEVVQ